jgi:cytoskeletal protein CcmA (bactofilin family)
MADLSACIVSVRGRFEGTLVADRAEILAGAHVSGQVHVNSIYLNEEAVLDAELFLLEPANSENIQRPEEITSDVITRTVQGAPNPPVELGT